LNLCANEEREGARANDCFCAFNWTDLYDMLVYVTGLCVSHYCVLKMQIFTR